MSGRWIGIPVKSIRADEENAEIFASEGHAVVYVDSLDNLDDLNIEASDVEMVDPEHGE